MNTLWGALLALISALGWGTASVLVKIGMKNKSAVTVNIIRLYITAIFYACLFFSPEAMPRYFPSIGGFS